MFLLVQLWYHIAAHRSGFQDKGLSIQDADHEAFKKLARRPHDWVVKEGVINRLRAHSGEITTSAANNLLPT